MHNTILTTKLALSRWQQKLHHLSTIVQLCNQGLDEPALRSLRSIVGSMQKEFKLTDQLLDLANMSDPENTGHFSASDNTIFCKKIKKN